MDRGDHREHTGVAGRIGGSVIHPLRAAPPCERPTFLSERGVITIALRLIDSGTAKDGKAAARGICTRMGWRLWPRIPRVSRSGTAGLAAAAVCGSGAVGIDVERVNPDVVDDSLLDIVLHPEERRDMPGSDIGRRFYSLWTRKEAVLKALGTGLHIPPTSILAGWEGESWMSVLAQGYETCLVRTLPAPDGFACAVAVVPEFGSGQGGSTSSVHHDEIGHQKEETPIRIGGSSLLPDDQTEALTCFQISSWQSSST